LTFGIPKVLSIVLHDPGYANLPSITYSDQCDRAMALSSQYNVCHPNPLIQVFYYCPNVRAVQAYLPWTFSTVISQRFMLLEKKNEFYIVRPWAHRPDRSSIDPNVRAVSTFWTREKTTQIFHPNFPPHSRFECSLF
jgi:hypothetical protein